MDSTSVPDATFFSKTEAQRNLPSTACHDCIRLTAIKDRRFRQCSLPDDSESTCQRSTADPTALPSVSRARLRFLARPVNAAPTTPIVPRRTAGTGAAIPGPATLVTCTAVTIFGHCRPVGVVGSDDIAPVEVECGIHHARLYTLSVRVASAGLRMTLNRPSRRFDARSRGDGFRRSRNADRIMVRRV